MWATVERRRPGGPGLRLTVRGRNSQRELAAVDAWHRHGDQALELHGSVLERFKREPPLLCAVIKMGWVTSTVRPARRPCGLVRSRGLRRPLAAGDTGAVLPDLMPQAGQKSTQWRGPICVQRSLARQRYEASVCD